MLTHQSYFDKLPRITPLAKLSDSSHPATNHNLSSHRTVAGCLVRISTAVSFSSAFAESVPLQGQTKPIYLFSFALEFVRKSQDKRLASLSYISLDYTSIHICVFIDED